MTVRVRYTLQSAISSTCAEERDLGNVYWQIVTDQPAKGGTWKTVLPAGSAAVQLQIDNISYIHLLIIRTVANNPNYTPNPITISLNSPTGPSFIIRPLGDAQEGHFLMSTEQLTAVYATNTGPCDMALTIIAAGDNSCPPPCGPPFPFPPRAPWCGPPCPHNPPCPPPGPCCR